MAIEIVDVIGLAHERKRRKMIMDTRKMHAWMHIYPHPGDHDDMHCHPGDQTFLLLEGQCTMHFPDGGASVLKPGMVALIEGGSFYKLENTGDGPMVLMGTRTGPHKDNKHINYETRKDMRGIRPSRSEGPSDARAADGGPSPRRPATPAKRGKSGSRPGGASGGARAGRTGGRAADG